MALKKATSIVQFRMDSSLKESTESILDTLGLSMTAAFTLFAKTVVNYKRIPFEISLPPNEETVAAIMESYDKDLPAIDGESYLSIVKKRRELLNQGKGFVD